MFILLRVNFSTPDNFITGIIMNFGSSSVQNLSDVSFIAQIKLICLLKFQIDDNNKGMNLLHCQSYKLQRFTSYILRI